MALPQHLNKYRGLVDLIVASVVRKIEAERAASVQISDQGRAACRLPSEPAMNSTAQQN
jgi:hypothetical protein